MEHIGPTQLNGNSRYVIIDVREYPEFAGGSITSARLVPLSTLEIAAKAWDPGTPYLFVCKTGGRARKAAAKLAQMNFSNLAVLDGGMDAWRQAGLPCEVAQSKPWSLERQVRTIAGAMILLWTILAIAVSPWFLAGTLFVGAGLLFAGVTDLCLMATVLGKMPWNRPSA